LDNPFLEGLRNGMDSIDLPTRGVAQSVTQVATMGDRLGGWFLIALSMSPTWAQGASTIAEHASLDDYTAELPSHGIDPAALRELEEQARETGSDAVVVLRNGVVIADWSFDTPRTPIESMSVTKSVVAVLLGRLVEEHVLSLDTPASRWFDAWDDQPHGAITLEHLLAHTSGVHTERTTESIYSVDDIVAFAVSQPLDVEPGTVWTYNNNTANLLPAIVAAEAGPIDVWAREGLFAPRKHQ
jgi:CubicO group peptidase (beta-lactamase class C family)